MDQRYAYFMHVRSMADVRTERASKIFSHLQALKLIPDPLTPIFQQILGILFHRCDFFHMNDNMRESLIPTYIAALFHLRHKVKIRRKATPGMIVLYVNQ